MTLAQYKECLRDLNAELKEAMRSGDEDRRLGVVMALEAFLSTVRIPPEESPSKAPKQP